MVGAGVIDVAIGTTRKVGRTRPTTPNLICGSRDGLCDAASNLKVKFRLSGAALTYIG